MVSPTSPLPRVLVIDNHDSFTYNVVHCLELAGARVEVVESDAIDADAVLARNASGIVISPGPCTPREAGCSLDLIQRVLAADQAISLLGLCLGHQAIAMALGGSLRRAKRARHGKTSLLRHDGLGLFAGLAEPLLVTRYNSLSVAIDSLPADLQACAWDEDGELMALRHRELPIIGLQFHPESWLCPEANALLERWVKGLRLARQEAPRQAAPRQPRSFRPLAVHP